MKMQDLWINARSDESLCLGRTPIAGKCYGAVRWKAHLKAAAVNQLGLESGACQQQVHIDQGLCATGSFYMQTSQGVIQGGSHKDCRLLERANDYRYSYSYSLVAQPPQKQSENRGVLPTTHHPSPA